MATQTEIDEVRSNTNVTITEYSDVTLGEYVDSEGTVECASAKVWRLETGKLAKNVSAGIKKANGGVESHEFQALKDQMETYKGMYDFYKGLCDESKGCHVSVMVKTKKPSVGGVISQDEIDELIDN